MHTQQVYHRLTNKGLVGIIRPMVLSHGSEFIMWFEYLGDFNSCSFLIEFNHVGFVEILVSRD